MCRMFFQCSLEPRSVEHHLLKKFVSTCRWQYLRRYNLFGHHGFGWGFAYIPENRNSTLVIKRDITPIYKANWKALTNIKTRFLLVHARKTLPWKKKEPEKVHPINIQEKFSICHNGIIKNHSFPHLIDPRLESIKNSSDLDTQKYLCFIIDELKKGKSLKEALESVFRVIEIGAGANAFLFNESECNVINYHNTNFNGRNHTLFISNDDGRVFVATTPLLSNAREIENHSLVNINLMNLELRMIKLEL